MTNRRSFFGLLLPLLAIAFASLIAGTEENRPPPPQPADGSPPPSSDAEDLLREAYFQETGLGDPLEAERRYREVLSLPAAAPRFLALAHLRLGICLHLRGEVEAARGEFQIVKRRYAGEADASRLARRYLGETARDPARYMPRDAVLYAELVEPGPQASFLADLIRGTPLENPIDSYLLSQPKAEGASRPRSAEAANGPLNHLRGVLNLSVLRELQKIEGVALGVTTFSPAQQDWLVVLLPGESELTRAILKAVLPAVMDSSEAQLVEGLRLFKLRQAPLHLAVADREEVVLLGSSESIVREAIRRAAQESAAQESGASEGAPTRARAGDGGSLAAVEDFRRAQTARTGSLLFLYADRRKLMEEIRAATPERERATFDEARKLLGLDHLSAVGATLARSGDDLRVTLRARIDREPHPLWPLLHTPPLGPNGLDQLPGGAVALFTTRIVEGEKRWESFRRIIDPLASGMPQEGGGKEVRSFLEFLDGELGAERGRSFLREVIRLSIAVPERLQPPWGLSFILALEFQDGERAQPWVEEFLVSLARRFFPGEGRPEFRDEGASGTMRLRSFSPAPGFRILYGRDGNVFLLSPLERVILDAVESRARGEATARGLFPPRASKGLLLRPDLLRRLGGDAPYRDGMDALVAHLPRALLLSEESADSFAIELRLPGTLQAIRETLRAMSQRSQEQPEPGEAEKK